MTEKIPEDYYLQVEDEPLIRDPHSKALISTDIKGYRNHKRRKRKIRDQSQRIDALEKKMDRILELLEKNA